MPWTDILNAELRSGVIETSPYDVPKNARGWFGVGLALSDADRRDPANHIELNVFQSRDEGQSWQHIFGFVFDGDPDYESDPTNDWERPTGLVDAADLADTKIKGVLNCNRTVNVGVRVKRN